MAFVPSALLAPRATLTQGSVSPPSMSSSAPVAVSRRALLVAMAALAGQTSVGAALADHTYQSARRSFDRYYPRIEVGVSQTKEIGQIVKAGGSIDEIVDGKLFDVKLRRAMSIYATSFSDNYLAERSRDLLKSVEVFFGEVGKAKEGEERVEHYNLAVNALVKYFEVARLDKKVLDGLYI